MQKRKACGRRVAAEDLDELSSVGSGAVHKRRCVGSSHSGDTDGYRHSTGGKTKPPMEYAEFTNGASRGGDHERAKQPPPSSALTPAVSLSSEWPIDHSVINAAVSSFIHEPDPEVPGPSMAMLLDPNVPPSAVLKYFNCDNEGLSFPPIEDSSDLGIERPYMTQPTGSESSFTTENGIKMYDQATTSGNPEATLAQPQSSPDIDLDAMLSGAGLNWSPFL